MEQYKNTLHCKDNLDLLWELPTLSIDLIYCDILYGTGKSFKNYTDLNAKDVKSIYDFYRERIMLMDRVLKSTGLMYLQMDYRIDWIVRSICHDLGLILRNQIVWQYNSAPKRKKDFGNRHDIILRYSKSDDYYFDPSHVRVPYAKSAPRGYEKEKYYHPEGKVIGDVWDDIPMLGQNDKTERCGYDTQKPLALMDRIILSSSKPEDTVADFFCGSGTFLVSAKTHGRNYIGCDVQEEAINKSKLRLEKAEWK